MTPDECKFLTSTCWNEKYQPVTIDMTTDNYTGRYWLGLNSFILPHSSPFWIIQMSFYPNVTEQDLPNLGEVTEQHKNQTAIKI